MLFYVFFEATLIPMYLVIGVWGGPNRVYAAVKFFLYTLLGSLLMLLAFLYLYNKSGGSFAVLDYHKLPLPLNVQILLFIAFLMAFAVKVPMWPVHTWLPDAHVEAPTGGSAVLAAILLEARRLRLHPLFAADTARTRATTSSGFMITLSLIAIAYIGLVALVQTDMKKLIAYSSISHMGFVTLGFFIFNAYGMEGGAGADDLARLRVGGAVPVRGRDVRPHALARHRRLRRRGRTPCRRFAALMMLFAMANCGLPATSGFVGEFMVIMGAMKFNFWIALVAGDDARLRRGVHAVDVSSA